ncbi:MAG TPA: DinB family protein [Gemmatimonadales bacterium]|nr:DinB family protein [Gemmatimonadales bacterium]
MPSQLSSKVPAWFERKFDFTFPVEQYPTVCVRLWGTPARLEEMLRTVMTDPDVLVATQQDKWSVQEQAGHLLDLEPLWMARVDDFLMGRDTLAAADPGNRKTHDAGHNARPMAEILTGFRTARLRLVQRLGTLASDAFARTSLHPRLKQPMRLVDHLHFVAEHDDHHLATIWELIATR